MKTLRDAPDLKGKKILLRVDWNVPVDKKGEVTDDYRIRQSLSTIKLLQESGATLTLITHREKGDESLKPVYEYAKTLLPELTFETDGPLKLLENLRKNPGEQANDEAFARELAALGDIYVNEAFSCSHRAHASIVGVPKFIPGFAGLVLDREIRELSKAFNPKHPFLFVLGGAKFDTKLPLLQKFIHIADKIFVGGALANNFFKEMGRDVGESLVSEGDFHLQEMMSSGKIILPEDTVTEHNKILDVGPMAVEQLRKLVEEANFVLWNGPLGNYELGFKVSTNELAKIIADSGKEAILGGGDTLASIEELGLFDKFSFVSTGGGAMLDFLAQGTLPGIEAIK